MAKSKSKKSNKSKSKSKMQRGTDYVGDVLLVSLGTTAGVIVKRVVPAPFSPFINLLGGGAVSILSGNKKLRTASLGMGTVGAVQVVGSGVRMIPGVGGFVGPHLPQLNGVQTNAPDGSLISTGQPRQLTFSDSLVA